MKKVFEGIYKINGKLATRNSSPGFRVYDEKLIRKKGVEYRIWDPYRSKLAAGILNGLKEFPYKRNSNILYLGASSGTTASHLADICTEGVIYCVELSKRMMQHLIPVTMKKTNMIPILADAKAPTHYINQIGPITAIYQDIAQKNQAEILLRNQEFLMSERVIVAIKARSINTVDNPKRIFKNEVRTLRKKFKILQRIDLRPYHKDHILVNAISM